jgi:hypothetical protein
MSDPLADFDDVILDVFGSRSAEFSPSLREHLRQLHREGIKQGMYREREHLPAPEGLFDVWERPSEDLDIEADPRRAPGKIGELEQAKEQLIHRIDDLAVEVDNRVQPNRTLGLRGKDLAIERHKIWTQIDALRRQVERMIQKLRSSG